MSVQILLLRGVNVGGHNRLSMKDLRTLAVACGAESAKTYLQSGNLVVSGDVESAALTRAIRATHGFGPRIVSRSLPEWRRLVRENPFPALADPRLLHVYFLSGPSDVTRDVLMQDAAPDEDARVTPTHIYLKTPQGLSRSRIASRLESYAGVEATARNWRTVTALLEMAEAL